MGCNEVQRGQDSSPRPRCSIVAGQPSSLTTPSVSRRPSREADLDLSFYIPSRAQCSVGQRSRPVGLPDRMMNSVTSCTTCTTTLFVAGTRYRKLYGARQKSANFLCKGPNHNYLGFVDHMEFLPQPPMQDQVAQKHP